MTEQTQKALVASKATEKIIKVLDPLSNRAKRRVLLFMSDLVQDPDSDCTFAQLEVLKEVAGHLGIGI